MRKKFKVEVGGKTFIVEVEDLGEEKESISKPQITSTSPTPIAPKPKEVEALKAPASESKTISGIGVVKAPLPGVILSVKCKVNDQIKSGDLLFTLEAMKMENEVYAPTSGTVKRIIVSEKDKVGQGDPLAVIE